MLSPGALTVSKSSKTSYWPPEALSTSAPDPKAERRAEIAEGMRYLHLSLTDPMRLTRSDDNVV